MTSIKHFEPMPALLEEAAKIIRSMSPAEFDRMNVRHFLCDELEGSAIMLRELIEDIAFNERKT